MVGTYRFVGDYTYNPLASREFPSAQLATILTGLPPRDPRPLGMFVRITHPKTGQILVDVMVERGERARTRLLDAANDDFRVTEGAVWLKPSKSSYGDGTGYVWANESVGFRKAKDGSLICEWRHGAQGLAMWVIPVFGNQVFWMRWRPFDAAHP